MPRTSDAVGVAPAGVVFHFQIKIPSETKAKQNHPKTAKSALGKNIDPNHKQAVSQELDDVHFGAEDLDFGEWLHDGDSATDVGDLSDKQTEHDEFPQLSWLEPINVVVTCNQPSSDRPKHHSRIGSCAAKLIRRKKIRAGFYEQMCKPSNEPTLLALDLFDRYGRLKGDYKNGRKGSGMWQEQLDDGDILLIEDISIQEDFRRRGLGTKMIKLLLDATRRKTEAGKIGLVLLPEPSKHQHFNDILKYVVSDLGNFSRPKILDHNDLVATFWARSLGFRRIGSSTWFGLVCETTQSGPAISIEDDYDLSPYSYDVSSLLPNAIRSARSDKKFLEAVQNHFHLEGMKNKQWLATDEEGNTLLHLAALHFFPRGVEWLMEKMPSDKLLDMRNSSGNTPLEALHQRLEIRRTRSLTIGNYIIIMSDKFVGHTREQAKCIALLECVEIDFDEDLNLCRYGCTCGCCIDGYISPRMNYALFMNASMHQDILADDLETLSGTNWVTQHDPSYLPDYCLMWMKRLKAVRKGYVRVFDHLVQCLINRSSVDEASLEAIFEAEDTEPKFVQRFLKVGGSFQAVIESVLESTLFDDDIYGTAMWLEDNEEDLMEAPPCRNDHDFVLVARMAAFEGMADHLSTIGQHM